MSVTDRTATDGDELADFGYNQSLDRSIGKFASFAAGISYISILTGCFQLFYFGFASGGPAYWWTWPMVFFGQLMVALCFAELAARYPVAGSIYNWSKRLGSATVSWLAGWMMLTASIVTISAVALAYQITLPQIDPFFQFVGDGTGTHDFALNAVILGSVLIIFTTLINAFGVRLMTRINSTGVAIELVAAVLLIIVLAANITRGPGVVFETHGTGDAHSSGYIGAFLVAALASAYVMYGFDTASSLGEETHDPRKTAPKAIVRAVVASFIIGGLILLFALMSVPNINAPEIGQAVPGGLQYVVLEVLGNTVGKIFLICVVIADDGLLPGGAHRDDPDDVRHGAGQQPARRRHLARIHPVTKTPIIPAVLIGVPGDPHPRGQHRPAADLHGHHEHRDRDDLHRVPARHRADAARAAGSGSWQTSNPGHFSLGKWGLVVNVLAVLWGFGDGAEPHLAAQGGLQRRRAVPLVPAVGRGALHRHRLLRRPRVLPARAAPQDRRPPRARRRRRDGARPITGIPPATPPAPATQG